MPSPYRVPPTIELPASSPRELDVFVDDQLSEIGADHRRSLLEDTPRAEVVDETLDNPIDRQIVGVVAPRGLFRFILEAVRLPRHAEPQLVPAIARHVRLRVVTHHPLTVADELERHAGLKVPC